MKHLIILVLAVLSFHVKVWAQDIEKSKENFIENFKDISIFNLPNYVEAIDHESANKPQVIHIKRFPYCPYCDQGVTMSALVFEDTQTMRKLFEVTEFKFKKLMTRGLYNDESDKTLETLTKASINHFGYHAVSWIIEEPKYSAQRKSSLCSIYDLGGCGYLDPNICQLLKWQTVKMRVHHSSKDNAFAEFIGNESKVIHEWEVPLLQSCL